MKQAGSVGSPHQEAPHDVYPPWKGDTISHRTGKRTPFIEMRLFSSLFNTRSDNRMLDYFCTWRFCCSLRSIACFDTFCQPSLWAAYARHDLHRVHKGWFSRRSVRWSRLPIHILVLPTTQQQVVSISPLHIVYSRHSHYFLTRTNQSQQNAGSHIRGFLAQAPLS